MDFIANATGAIFAQGWTPELQKLVAGQQTPDGLLKAVQAEYEKELAASDPMPRIVAPADGRSSESTSAATAASRRADLALARGSAAPTWSAGCSSCPRSSCTRSSSCGRSR